MPTVDPSSDDPPLYAALLAELRARDEPTSRRHRGVGYGPAGGGGHRWRDDDTGEVVVGRRHDDDLDGVPNYLDPDSPEYEGAPVERNEMGGPLLARSMVAAGAARGLDGSVIQAALAAVGAVGKQIGGFAALAAGARAALQQAPRGLTKEGAAAFLATCAQESAYFRTTTEYGKSLRYDPYRGRTFTQITWEGNYRSFGQWCHARGLVADPEVFVKNPAALSDLQWAWLGPIQYWETHGIWRWANAGQFRSVSQAINGGNGKVGTSFTPHGWAERQAMYAAFLRGGDSLLPGPAAPPEPPPARALGTELVMDPIAMTGRGSRRVFFDTVGPPGKVIEAGWVSLGIDGVDGASASVRVAPQKPGGGTGPARDLKAGALTDGSHTSGRDGMALPTGTDQAQLTWEVSAGATAYLVPAFRAAK